MTQPAVPVYTFYLGDGVQTIFPYAPRVGVAAELEVYVGSFLSTAYALTGVNSDSGGTVVFYAPPPAGSFVFLRRVTAKTQLVDPTSNDPFDMVSYEAALDKLTREIQDLEEIFSRIPQFPITTGSLYRNMRLPTPMPLKLLGFTADGTGLTIYDPTIRQVIPDPVSGLAWGKHTVPVISVAGLNILTATAVFPAGTVGVGATLRVTTPFGATNGLTTVSVGTVDIRDLWGTGLDIKTMLVTNPGQWRALSPLFMVPAALDVLITADDGNLFDITGALTVTGHYLTVTPD